MVLALESALSMLTLYLEPMKGPAPPRPLVFGGSLCRSRGIWSSGTAQSLRSAPQLVLKFRSTKLTFKKPKTDFVKSNFSCTGERHILNIFTVNSNDLLQILTRADNSVFYLSR